MKTRTGELDPATAGRVLAVFRQHLAQGVYRQVPIEAAHYRQATDWIAIFATALRALDALHLAAAGAANLPLLTADQALAAAAASLGVPVQLIP